MALTLATAFAFVASVSSSSFFAAAAPNIARQIQSVENCTTSSFTIPSWFVQDFRTEAGKASFGLVNRATNLTLSLSCQPGEGSEWSSCTASGESKDPSLEASAKVDTKSAGIKVKQSWTCNDRNTIKPISLIATGTSSVPLSCEGGVCKSSNPVDLIKGSLQAPVSINPAYADGPDGHDKTGCGAASQTPKWTLGTVIYLNETGDGIDALPSQSIQFQVTNEATGHVAGCLMYFTAAANEDPAVRINCGGGTDSTRRNRYSIQTQAVFYPRSRTFTLNQTWFCDDVDAARPTAFAATGSTTLALTCTLDGTTTACQADALPLTGALTSSTPLPPYSIEDPLPTPDGCTISSFVSPSWTLSNFEVESNASSPLASAAFVGFNMRLNTKVNTFDYPVFVNHDAVRLGEEEAWYPCAFGAGEQPLAPKACEFRYRAGERVLGVKADWVCIDLDGERPIQFSGVATTKLPELSCVTASSGLSTCGTGQNTGWVAEVANVTWKTLDGLTR